MTTPCAHCGGPLYLDADRERRCWQCGRSPERLEPLDRKRAEHYREKKGETT